MTRFEADIILKQFDSRWSDLPYHYEQDVDNSACESLQDAAYDDAKDTLKGVLDDMVEKFERVLSEMEK